MSFEVTTAFVNDYKATIEALLQQKESRFESAVSSDNYTGKGGKVVEQIGATTARKKTTRHGDTPLISTPHDARWVYPSDYEWADLIDNEDKLRMIVDPTSPYAVNGASAMKRAKDDEIVAAFFGTAKTGEDGDVSTTFPAAQQVAVTVGAGAATGLNVAKLRAAKKILMANEVDLDSDMLFVSISAVQHDNMLAEIQAISLDYNDRPVLVEGRITAFMGFNFIHSERLGTDGTGYRRLPCWSKSGMHLGRWNDITTRVSERADKSHATQIYLSGTFGATRVEEGKVVEIKCSEA